MPWLHLVAVPAAFVVGALALSTPSHAGRPQSPAVPPADRDVLLSFAADVATRHSLELSWVAQQLQQTRKLPAVQRLIMPPPVGVPKNWATYRARFIEARRIDAGLAFWRQHEATLERAEAEYGVPAHIIVGIIGVETFYGRITGDFRVIDALATLAFDFPPGRRDRSAFFRDELEQLLIWSAREGLDPQSVKGSYAGAVGLPQFMPGSINRHAIDYDGDGHIDLRGSAADAIGSVARYLAAHGWQRGTPTHFAVAAPSDPADRAVLLEPDIVPTFTTSQFAERGASLALDGAMHVGPLALVELQNADAEPTYVAGTANFYAVTRYNWSSYYALAVIELGEAIAALR